jgi:hypothetical protein
VPANSAVPSNISWPPPRGAVPSKTSNPPPRGSVPPKSRRPPPLESPDLLDDGEQTQVNNPLDSSDENVQTQVLNKSQPGWDDEGETTQVFDKSKDELLDAAARVTGPPQGAWRPSSPAPRPAAGSPPAVTTIIVQDHTSPALRRNRPAFWVIGLAWLWGSPRARARRVGLVAGVAGLLVGVAYGYGAHAGRPLAPRASQQMAEAPHSERPPVVATTVAEPQPRGIDPSMLPKAPPDETQARHVVKPVQVSLDTAAPSPPPEAPAAAPGPPSPSDSDDLESPYAHAVSARAPKATKPPRAPVAKALPPSAPSAPVSKASAPKAAGGCAQPFTLDDHGIRRIKPECL